jgi:hypothetical protein
MSDVQFGDVWLSFSDLEQAGIVSNWQTLNTWIDRRGFPSGHMLGPNSRRWRKSEVDAWLATRPVERKAIAPKKTKTPRRRKAK